jgi:Ni2+-binding GTPase involved in maturation of urease and hydrogenase
MMTGPSSGGSEGANLPITLTGFIGRARELSRLADLLTDAPLVTLVGPGGCGKTRLGLQLARNLQDRYEGGCWFVDLTLLSSSEPLYSLIWVHSEDAFELKSKS